jgi:hypothetical protein
VPEYFKRHKTIISGKREKAGSFSENSFTKCVQGGRILFPMLKALGIRKSAWLLLTLLFALLGFAVLVQRSQPPLSSVSPATFFSVPSTIPVHEVEAFMQFFIPDSAIEYSTQFFESEPVTLPTPVQVQPLPLPDR